MVQDCIFVVSGLPRSGTSLMMQMLKAGGVELMTDNLRQPDADNPNGYYEIESVKKLGKGGDIPDSARGKAVKIISELLTHLPARHSFKIIFMRRKMAEILASQNQMLIRRGMPIDRISDEKMGRLFEGHLEKMRSWLSAQDNVDVCYVDFNRLLEEPIVQVKKLEEFIDGIDLDTIEMVKAVDPKLYRQRK